MAKKEMSLKKKALIGVGVGAAVGGIIYAVTRKKGLPEPEPPIEGRANIYGLVTDASTGQPLEGVQVTIASIVEITNPSGEYLHEDIVPGNYLITFALPDYETVLTQVYLAEGNNLVNAELVLISQEAEFHCGVWDSVTNEPIVNALVILQGPVTVESRVNSWGDCSFYSLPAGDYSISISMNNYQPLQQNISIPPGRTEKEFHLVYTEPSELEGIEVMWIDLPEITDQGQQFTVVAQCVNESGAEGDFDIPCTINGQTFVETIHMSYPGWKQAIFRLEINEPGAYNVCVGSQCKPIIIREVVTGNFVCPFCGETGFNTLTDVEWHFNHARHTSGLYFPPEFDWHINLGNTSGLFWDAYCIVNRGFVNIVENTTIGIGGIGQVKPPPPPEWENIKPDLACKLLWRTGGTYIDSKLAACILMNYYTGKYGVGMFEAGNEAQYKIPWCEQVPPIRDISETAYFNMKQDFTRAWQDRAPLTC